MKLGGTLPGLDWYPVDYDSAARSVTWLHLPGERFCDAFFEDTLRRHGKWAQRTWTSISALCDPQPGGRDPAAIFFHSSRCGSTLLMQLLGLVPGCRALSEPPILDQFLQDPTIQDCQLRGLVRALGRTAETATRTFLKTDSWHLPHLKRIRRTFPRTRCFFLYRNPADILRSHRRERGLQMVPGMLDPKIFDIDPATMDSADLEGYAERVLSAIFDQAVQAVEAGHLIPVAHSQLPNLAWDQLGPFLGLPENGWELAKKRSAYDAKHRHHVHQPAAPAQAVLPATPALARDFERLEFLCQEVQKIFVQSACRSPLAAT